MELDKAERQRQRLAELAQQKELEEQERELQFLLEQEEAKKREQEKALLKAKRKLVCNLGNQRRSFQ